MFRSVAISANGEYVVAGDNSGYLCYFNDSRTAIDERPSPTWESTSLFGQIQRGTLDMSDDGEYVVVVGTGSSLYYFANCTTRSSFDENPTWQKMFDVADFLTVDLSPDGRYVAAGGSAYGPEGFVIFYKDANIMPYPTEEAWFSTSSINSSIIDLALSYDGYAVAAIDQAAVGTLYYWANATTLSGDPNATWTNSAVFHCVDMSADGDEVIAGTAPLFPCGLHFWADARERSGSDQVENWIGREGEIIWDVAMSDNGGLIAASAQAPDQSNYTAYFFKSDGNMIDKFDLPQYSPLVSMSGNGLITAVAGLGFDSLYVFKTIIDSTPPLIENVHQQPTNENVHPEDDVMVYANVTDDLSGVKQVILNYTYTNSTGTWHGTITMGNPEGNIYNGTIPRLPYCTNVTYVIIAEDNFNNTVTTEEMGREYKYHVIPEFPPQFVLPLLVTATLLAMLLRKRKLIHQAKT
jgi:WD40 repeat protein